MLNYTPVINSEQIYHRSGWRYVIKLLQEFVNQYNLDANLSGLSKSKKRGVTVALTNPPFLKVMNTTVGVTLKNPIFKNLTLIDLVDNYYHNPKNPAINQPWFGFIHSVPDLAQPQPKRSQRHRHPLHTRSNLASNSKRKPTPTLTSPSPSPTLSVPTLKQLLNDPRFKRDLFYCQGIIVFSKYLANCLESEVTLHRFRRLKIVSLYHPTELDVTKFNLTSFKQQSRPYLVFIGNQDRRFDRFYKCRVSIHGSNVSNGVSDGVRDGVVGDGVGVVDDNKTRYHKIVLTGYDPETSYEIVKTDLARHGINYSPSQQLDCRRLTGEEYDLVLSSSIIVTDLYNSSVNNTVLECLARTTPILVNRVGGVEEYLGKDYPLYFDNLLELETKLASPELFEMAHQYLCQHDQTFISGEKFKTDLKHSIE